MSFTSTDNTPASRPVWARPFALGVWLFVAVVIVYLRTLSHGFIWDDDLHVTANPRIVGPEGLAEIWSSAAANYFPLVLTNFWLQHALWGLQPLGYHAVTIVCHALSAVLLWRVLLALVAPNSPQRPVRRSLGEGGSAAKTGAWLGAALWALHPVQVESVAWISELKNTQSAIFFLLSILFWLKWLEVGRGFSPPSKTLPTSEGGLKQGPTFGGRSWILYALAVFCGLLAILSKPSTVMLPVVLGLCTWWRRGTLGLRDGFALAPLFALSALASGWTIWEQQFHSGAVGPEWNQTLPERIAIAGKIAWFYLGKLLWPHPLTFIYPRWVPSSAFVAFLPALAAAAGLALLWWRRDRWRPAFVAAVFFLTLLFPILNFFKVYFFRYSFVGDHFQYLASMGPLALLGIGLAQLPRRVFASTAAVLLLAYSGLTWWHSAHYRSSVTLWQATLADNPGATMAWFNLGDSLSVEQRYPEAIAAYREALRRQPDSADGYNDLGCIYTLIGDPETAIRELQHAIALQPDFPAAHNNLGNAYHAAGRPAEAIAAYTEAIRLKPGYADALGNLGSELAGAGRPAEAIPHFEAVHRARPADPKARNDLAKALQALAAGRASVGDWREAVALFERAVSLQPDSLPAQAGLAVALVNANRLEEAVPVFQTALRLDPKSAELHDNFGQVLNALGRKREALEHLDEAARLRRR